MGGIVTANRLSSALNLNSSFFEFSNTELGFVLEYAPKLPPPLPLMCILQLEESLVKSTDSTAPPELYIFVSPIGAN